MPDHHAGRRAAAGDVRHLKCHVDRGTIFRAGFKSPFPDAFPSSFVHAVTGGFHDLNVPNASVGLDYQREGDVALCPEPSRQFRYLAGRSKYERWRRYSVSNLVGSVGANCRARRAESTARR